MKPHRRSLSKNAFSLIEVVLAIGIVSFSMLTLVALVTSGLRANRQSVEETEATNILALIQADVLNIPRGSTSASVIYGLRSPFYQLPSGLTGTNYLGVNGENLGTTFVSQSQFRMEFHAYRTSSTATTTYNFPTPGGVYVSISWPAKPGSVAATGQVETFIGVIP